MNFQLFFNGTPNFLNSSTDFSRFFIRGTTLTPIENVIGECSGSISGKTT